MLKKVAIVALLLTSAANAATIVFNVPRMFKPAEVWGVSDPEMMTIEVVDGRPSFRRPGEQQCLEKYADGPVPCIDLIDLPSEDFMIPENNVYAPPRMAESFVRPPYTSSFTSNPPPVYFCCDDDDDNPDEPPPPPAVPLPASILMLLASLLGLALLRRRT